MLSYSPSMFFFVKYQRSTGTLLAFEQYASSEELLCALNATDAFDENGHLLLDQDIEIVTLMSSSVDALKVTQSRYFAQSPKDLQPTLR